MGVTSSRIEEDKALLLCRERKHFVKQALDGRCALAAAHVSYVQSLKKTGAALRKFVEPEVPIESSLCTSTSATPEPLALTEKSASQLSNSSPSLSQHAERAESVSPLPSSPYSGRFQVNYMKLNGSLSKTVEERPPSSVIATLHTSSDISPKVASHSDETSTFEDAAVNSRWDFFNMHPIDDQFSFHDSRTWNHGFENGDDFRRLREEEGIPELEEEEERASVHGMSECLESDDEFDQSSSEPLVRIFKNRNQMIEPHLVNGSSIPFQESKPLESVQKNEGRPTSQDGTCEAVGDPDSAPGDAAPSTVMPLINGKKHAEKEHGSDNRVAAKDLLSSIKDIESLFLKASECGKEVPRMLEADKVNFHPLFSEGKASKMKGSMFLTAFFVCCKEEIHISQDPATNDIKYLTWHRSVSSRSSSSRNPIGATSKDDIGDSSSTLFSNICMNSGSHASTLDRLYAWERKLYDEVKASGIIRRKYDMMCRQLRHQDSKGESTYKIDKTRAAVKDLHSRIRVALHRIDSISKKIEELRDKELHPQLEELIGGLFRMWEMMHEYHKLQYDIISVAYNNGNSKLLMQSEFHHQAAVVLEDELNGLGSSFTKWIAAHKSYLQAINGWLLKCYFPVQLQKPRKGNSEFNPWRLGAPPIYVTCQHWLRDLDTLPTRELADAIKRLAVEATHSLPHQDKNNRKSNLPFSTLKIGKRQRLSEDVQRNEDPVDWSLCLESLQKGLKSFLDQLKTFAEKSVGLYGDLRKATEEAKNRYENAPLRAQMLFMA